MKYVQILASTFAFAAAAALLVQMRQFGHPYLYVVLFLLCGANLLSRLTETHIGDQIAEAEEKVAKRVIRRLAKVMPELIDEYFKAQAAEPATKLSDIIFWASRDALATKKALLAEDYKQQPKQDSSKGIYVCVYCRKLLGSELVGAGNGRGERFAHPECYEAEHAKQSIQIPDSLTAEDHKLSDVIVVPKRTVAIDAKGTTVISATPDCTAAEINAAVGAEIARSVSHAEG